MDPVRGLSDVQDVAAPRHQSPETNASVASPVAVLGHPFLQADKVQDIKAACSNDDVAALIKYATSPLGFVSDECRRLAWPLVLGCNIHLPSASENVDRPDRDGKVSTRWQDLSIHTDERQAGLDVERSFVYYPKDDGAKQTAARKEELGSLITQTLRQAPYLCYFQGYHDIVQVLLLVLGREGAVDAVARLSVLRIRDFMLPSLAAATVHLGLLPHIIHAMEPELERRLSQTQPFFALSATLTLYAHEIEEYADIARLFDFFLTRSASMPIYFFATVVTSRKRELLEIDEDEPEMLHSILSKIPTPLDLEDLIARTVHLYEAWPPDSLPGNPWRAIDRNSALKTTQDIVSARKQSLQQGEAWFHKQERKLGRDQNMQNISRTIRGYRRPAQFVGIAVAIAVLAWWLRRDGNATAVALTAMRRCRALCGL